MNPPPFSEDPNLANLNLMVATLGDLCNSMVFVGGCATGLLVTSVQAQPIRVTRDIDVVASVVTRQEFYALAAALQARGFAHDVSEGAPICRWSFQGVVLDCMPVSPDILGFSNRWYPLAFQTAKSITLPSGAVIQLIAAPVFLATKLEAFRQRGRDDYLASHDLEDVVTIVDGRASLYDEVIGSPDELKQYLRNAFRAMISSQDFLDALAGHLPGDRASQAKLPSLRKKLERLAEIK